MKTCQPNWWFWVFIVEEVWKEVGEGDLLHLVLVNGVIGWQEARH